MLTGARSTRAARDGLCHAAHALSDNSAIPRAWALAKTAVSAAAFPLTLPALSTAALASTRANAARIAGFGQHLVALAEGTDSPLLEQRTVDLDADQRYLITSDLHRCVAGRLDWPARQGVKDLYRLVIQGYGEEGWHLIENGDVEDFWVVGGSVDGVRYDVANIAGHLSSAVTPALRRRVWSDHLDRIVANNAETYSVIRDEFLAHGRYHRTMGNHDDVYTDEAMVAHLQRHLPGLVMADTILLRTPLVRREPPPRHGQAAAHEATTPGLHDVEAVVAHGHLTDSWNGPGFASLGRAVTWFGTTLDDLFMASDDARPGARQLEALLEGRARNRLTAVDPYYGGNRRLDSVDEQRLFAALAEHEPDGGWPWILFGHTHLPRLSPLDAAGRSVRYANSGHGLLPGAFTALEWDPSAKDGPVRLVLWRWTAQGPRRHELVPSADVLTCLG